jgi:hypothetical protein
LNTSATLAPPNPLLFFTTISTGRFPSYAAVQSLALRIDAREMGVARNEALPQRKRTKRALHGASERKSVAGEAFVLLTATRGVAALKTARSARASMRRR